MTNPEREPNANRALADEGDPDVRRRSSAEMRDGSPLGLATASAETDPSNDTSLELNGLSRFDVTRSAMLVWVSVVIVMLGYVLFGEVTTYPFDEEEGRIEERTMGVTEVWGLLRDDLPDVEQPALTAAVFYGAILLIVVGTLWALLLALGTRLDPKVNRPGTSSNDSLDLTATNGRVSESR